MPASSPLWLAFLSRGGLGGLVCPLYMKKSFFIGILIVLSNTIFAQNFSISVDPITFIGLLLSLNDENGEQQSTDISNIWVCVEFNMETNSKKELGFGIFVRADRVAVRTQYRSFYNKERQSGFFW
ncbi:MAG: hypothetical protein LBL76_08310, partial [Treponema sp.]|nr:hypothetical protein [Treponema sp.]